MKKLLIATVAMGLAVPASAGLFSGGALLNVAKIILNNRAVLNKGATQCPQQVVVAPQESILMTAARAAVQKALPTTQFSGLETAADRIANRSAAAPTFCQTTAVKKPGLLGGIADAARKMGVGGGILGAPTQSTTSNGAGVLGSILGGAKPAGN
jgi:hypothetical protein